MIAMATLGHTMSNEQDTFGTVLGSACWPSLNENPWTVTNPDCHKYATYAAAALRNKG